MQRESRGGRGQSGSRGVEGRGGRGAPGLCVNCLEMAGPNEGSPEGPGTWDRRTQTKNMEGGQPAFPWPLSISSAWRLKSPRLRKWLACAMILETGMRSVDMSRNQYTVARRSIWSVSYTHLDVYKRQPAYPRQRIPCPPARGRWKSYPRDTPPYQL